MSMIDLFYPPGPQAFRKGRVVAHFDDGNQPTKKRPKGRDPAKGRAKQARYRARMMADPARHEKHIAACKKWHDDNKAYSLAQARAWKADAKKQRHQSRPGEQ